MYQFKSLPWRVLINAAVLTLLFITSVDYGLTLILPPASLQQILSLFARPFGLLFSFAVDMVIGIMGVIVLETLMRKQYALNVSILWGLILCLILALVLKSFIPISGVFLNPLHQITMVGIVLGVFGKGRQYW